MAFGEDTSPEIERIAAAMAVSADQVHRHLGPGLLESAYKACSMYELNSRGFVAEREQPFPLVGAGLTIDAGFKLDLLVNGLVIVELKAVQDRRPIYKAQLLTHLTLCHLRLGLPISFNVILMKGRIRRLLNNWP